MQPKLTFNCPEKWESMEEGNNSRHCLHCSKNVYDFTSMTREEIYLFYLNNGGKEVCGRILPSQLENNYKDSFVIINALSQKRRHANLAFHLLAVGSITILSCNNVNSINTQAETLTYEDSLKQRGNTIRRKQIPIVNLIDRPMLGGVGWEYLVVPVNHTFKDPYTVFKVMPEYKGGTDELFKYLRTNIKYPAWEKRNKVEGTVDVSFIVEKDGTVTNPEIVDSPPVAKNFNKEVLRVINNMPPWQPKPNGKSVAVKVTVPIKFQL